LRARGGWIEFLADNTYGRGCNEDDIDAIDAYCAREALRIQSDGGSGREAQDFKHKWHEINNAAVQRTLKRMLCMLEPTEQREAEVAAQEGEAAEGVASPTGAEADQAGTGADAEQGAAGNCSECALRDKTMRKMKIRIIIFSVCILVLMICTVTLLILNFSQGAD
jgi:hypothetical protein